MGIKVANNAFGTLASSITNSATSITLTSGQGARFPTLDVGDYFYATLIDTSNNLEIVKCTARSTDVLTVTRAQENTTARAYSAGDRIEIRLTAQTFVDAVNEIGPTQVSDEANTSTGYFDLPSGTTAQRPGSPSEGMFRHNTDLDIVEFYDSGTWKQVSANYPIEILLVAGGGGGAHYNSAGGGGAGGLLYYGAENPKTPNGAAINVLSGGAYAITVGAGGIGSAGSPLSVLPTAGGNSVFSGPGGTTLTAIGGGYGSDGNLVGNAGSGGSGGGARASSPPASLGGAGTSGQGNKGGDSGVYEVNYPGGGGGGAGAAGGNGSGSTIAGAGGVGLAYSISGSSVYYAGGGGGSTQSGGTGGAGGNGGGGAGGTSTNSYTPTAGTANRGGGGGAGGYGGTTIYGANGGSGVVILRYQGAQRGIGGTVTSSGGYTIHTFTSSGTFTA